MEAEWLEDGHELGRHGGSEGAGQFVGGNLDAHQLAVESHAELAEAERPQRLFAALDGLDGLFRGRSAIGDARAEAGGSRSVPRRQAGQARKLADFGFPQPGVYQRRFNLVLLSRLLPWAVIAQVVHVDAVHDVLDRPLAAERLQALEQLVLAVEATIGCVADVIRVLELACGDVLVPESKLARQRLRVALVRGGDGCGVCRDNQRVRASKRAVGGPSQVGRVRAAGVGNNDSPQFAQPREEALLLLGQQSRVQRFAK